MTLEKIDEVTLLPNICGLFIKKNIDVLVPKENQCKLKTVCRLLP